MEEGVRPEWREASPARSRLESVSSKARDPSDPESLAARASGALYRYGFGVTGVLPRTGLPESLANLPPHNRNLSPGHTSRIHVPRSQSCTYMVAPLEPPFAAAITEEQAGGAHKVAY